MNEEKVTRKDLNEFKENLQERLDLLKRELADIKSMELKKAYLENYRRHGIKLWSFANAEEEHQATNVLINFHRQKLLNKSQDIEMIEHENMVDGYSYQIIQREYSENNNVPVKVGFGTVTKGEPN
jgi:hypothetical protein